ncbi:MAG: DUF1343 domain-containing protein [Bacteroidota bacterium]
MFDKAIILFTLHLLPFTLSAVSQVTVGADRLFSHEFHLVAGKRLGLVTNHTGLLSNGRHLADSLFARPEVTLAALFGPEHGIRGEVPAGGSVGDGRDSATGVTVFSLYGKTYKPTPEMLKGIDVLLFDIQDVGARFYTYISTMSYAMEAAAENGIPFIVLDRPNPITGIRVEGPIREDLLRSFVGLHPIPIVHGMTVGELATMFNEEGWLKGGVKADLHVVKMEGWKRTMWYDETGLKWIPPSPNIRTLSTAIVYPGTCLIEGTNLSEGRGTDRPFEYVGAPFVDGARWAEELNELGLPGVKFSAITFTPRSTVGSNPKHAGIECNGIVVEVTDREVYEPVKTGVEILSTGKELFARDFRWRESSIDRLAGTPLVRQGIDKRVSGMSIANASVDKLRKFMQNRLLYLLY